MKTKKGKTQSFPIVNARKYSSTKSKGADILSFQSTISDSGSTENTAFSSLQNDVPNDHIKSIHKISKRIILNVGGMRQEISLNKLKRLPNSRLGKLRELKNGHKILDICDGYSQENNEFFFDRSPRSFEPIINFYRTGKLHINEDTCVFDFCDELNYWGIEEYYIEPCCQTRYHQKKEQITDDLKKNYLNESKTKEETFSTCFPLWRRRLWNLLEKPRTSRAAQVVAFLSVFFIALSMVNLTISTLPRFKRGTYTNLSLSQHTHNEPTFIVIIETCCMVWFTIEYIVRFIASPRKIKFMKSLLNTIDLLSVLPFYVTIILEYTSIQESSKLSSMRRLLPVFRILRIMRILKLARHSIALQSLGYTLRECYKELGMLAVFLLTGIMLFSSLAYFAEKEVNGAQFMSIPHAFWWAAITMTTVGYGDIYPVSFLGKIIGTLCCICGVLVIALPIPIIVNNFAEYYSDQIRREKSLRRAVQIQSARDRGSFIELIPTQFIKE